MSKINNTFLRQFFLLASKNPWFTMDDCCAELQVSKTQVNGWKRKLKQKQWRAGHANTEDKEPLDQESIDLFLSISFKKGLISNEILNKIINYSEQNPTYSLEVCCKQLNYNYSTAAKWYRNFRDKIWNAGYNNTADGQEINQETIDKFLNSFIYSIKLNKILFKLVNYKALKEKHSFATQKKYLQTVLEKYPNLDFWLYVDLGPKRDHVYSYLKFEKAKIKQKYLEFTNKIDNYSKFEYKYEPKENNTPRKKKKKNIWDFY